MENTLTDKFNLTVQTGDQASEVFIIDSNFQKVASAVGSLTNFELPKGLYTVKVREANAVNEQSLGLFSDKSLQFAPLQFSTPAPLNVTAKTTSAATEKAQRSSNEKNISIGTGSEIYIFVRYWTENVSSEVLYGDTDAAIGLTLRDLKNNILVDFGMPTIGKFETGENCWSACNVEVNPGVYLLNLETATGDMVQQSMVASPGWQTQVFLLKKDYGCQNKDIRADLANSSILLARMGNGFVPSDPTFRLTEIAKFALINNRQVLNQGVIDELLDEKFYNPMLGIYAIHLLIASESKRDQIKRIIGHLRMLLGSPHPDVEAVALKLNMPSDYIFTAPPMLKNSWKYVIEASTIAPHIVPESSLAYGVAGKLLEGAPWLVWGEFLKPFNSEQILTSQLKNLINLTTSPTSNSIRPDDTMATLNNYLVLDQKTQKDSYVRDSAGIDNVDISNILNNVQEQSRLIEMLGVPKAKFDSLLLNLKSL